MIVSPTAILSPNARIRHPDGLILWDYAVIDDFTYCSTRMEVGKFSHIAANCTIAGGKQRSFYCGDFGGLASGCRVYCASDDLVNDIGTVLPWWAGDIKNHLITGDVILDNYVTIGANSVVMPSTHIPEGVTIGALSFVPRNYEFKPWRVYAGSPRLHEVGQRNKENVLRQVEEIEDRLRNHTT